MRHTYKPVVKNEGKSNEFVVPACSCGWEYHASFNRSANPWSHGLWPYQIHQRARGKWEIHRDLKEMERRYPSKRLELVATTEDAEYWVGWLFGDKPPKFSTKWDRNGVKLIVKRRGGWGGDWDSERMGHQYTYGKVRGWIVYKRNLREDAPNQWSYVAAYKTKNDARFFTERRLGRRANLNPRGTTFTPRAPDFEHYIKRLAKEVRSAKTPAQKTKALKKMRKINAVFEILREAEQDMIRDMTPS